jgi:hypothetical protein
VKRPSKLHKGNWHFIKRQAAIIARTYATYEPLKTFSYIAGVFFVLGMALLGRAGYIFIGRRLMLIEESNEQSLLVGSMLVILAATTFLIGLLADRVGGVRRLEEEVLYRVRAMQAADEAWRRTITTRLEQVETQSRPGVYDPVGPLAQHVEEAELEHAVSEAEFPLQRERQV